MYDKKNIVFVGKHDYDKSSALTYCTTFSINIFRWELKRSGKEMKRSKCVVRVNALGHDQHKIKKAFDEADRIVLELDSGTWLGNKSFNVKYW